MLRSEFIPYREAVRAPLEQAAVRLERLGTQAREPLLHLDQVLKDAEQLNRKLEVLIGGDFYTPARLLIGRYHALASIVASECNALTALVRNAEFLRLSAAFLSETGNNAEPLDSETVKRIVNLASYGISVATILAGGPVLTVTGVLIGGIVAADDMRKLIWIGEQREKERRRQFRDEDLRNVLNSLVRALTDVDRQLERAESSFEATYKAILRDLTEFSKNAKDVISLNSATPGK